MYQNCWKIGKTGFLIHPEPLQSLTGYLQDEIAEHLDSLIDNLADSLENKQIRAQLDALSAYDISNLVDSRAIERAFQIYAYFASAYVYATGETPAKHIPAGVAVPLVQLAEKVKRPPILSYAPYTLANWRKIDPDGEIVIENLELLHKFIHKRDATWFTLIHVEIEAKAAPAISAIREIEEAITQENNDSLMNGLSNIHDALINMMGTLKRMPEHCHPTVYYNEVRPYIFSFEDVVYDGVEQYKNQPQSFVGETGAQSSIIPALVRLMGLSHEENSMTKYLMMIQNYMPEPHRDLIRRIKPDALRGYIQIGNQAPLIDMYNTTLRQLLAFRQLHIRYAASYIANQSADTVGTGGTRFMHWLQQLIDETEAQFLS